MRIGEWWDRNIIDVMQQALFTGAAPNVSDAYTINGQPGDLYKCSTQGTLINYSLRLIYKGHRAMFHFGTSQISWAIFENENNY